MSETYWNRISAGIRLPNHWRSSPYIKFLPNKVLISEDVAFSLTSVHRFVHQPLSSFSFHTIEFNKPEIILLSILSFLLGFFFVQNSKPPSFGFAGRWHHNSFNMYVLRLKVFCWLFFSDGSFSSMFYSSFWQKTFFSANTYPQKCL